jgi:hypothetical protein
MEVIMSKFTKKFMYILFAAIAIAILLLPAPGLMNHTANLEATQQSAPDLVWDFPKPGSGGGFNTPLGYTWAG